MFEMLLSPRKAKRRPWEMFFVGLVYASLSTLIVQWVFSGDAVLSKYSGLLLVTFTTIFSLPFVYFLIKDEEKKDTEYNKGRFRMLREHTKAVFALLWLFIGFVVAFSFWYIVLSSSQNFKVQIETYCFINRPSNFDSCIEQYQSPVKTTGFSISKERILTIFSNNLYVLVFTLIFSLLFGAGAIFILAWNASVIAAAVGIFTKSQLSHLPLGMARYFIHGLPEITAYFIGALAGGILSIAIIRHDTKAEKFWKILQDSLSMVIIAVIILFLAALIEVFITPAFFG